MMSTRELMPTTFKISTMNLRLIKTSQGYQQALDRLEVIFDARI